mmetsp:Transcript_17336/g.29311  ORF Transcript_17336/g.29311 Transcript_17336/m.29311 type:complete len:434 (-) Transcript_17336:159-1460(-)
MGGSVGTLQAANREVDYLAFQIIRDDYERIQKALKESSEASEDEKVYTIATDSMEYCKRVEKIYQSVISEKDSPIERCRCPAVILYRYGQMTAEDRKKFNSSVFESAETKERKLAKALVGKKPEDYSQSFGGTAADTKNEKEAAAILRGEGASGDEGAEEDALLYPLLVKPDFEQLSSTNYDTQQLRHHGGRWGKYLGSSGCYLYMHSLTKEVLSLRPEDYNDDEDGAGGSGGLEGDEGDPAGSLDPANGLQTIQIENLIGEVNRIATEEKKTPLLIDRSANQAVRAFYSYKGCLEDVSQLTIPFGKSGVKKEDVMERCRVKLVSAIKTGAVFALYMGDVGIDHADFKGKLCKKNVFPKETFQQAGAKLLGPDYDPKYKAVFREPDLEAGQAIAREGFQVVVISSLDPYEYEAALSDCLPLGYMKPIYVASAE